MSFIHFKSVVDTNYNQVTFDGVHLTLVQLKKLIFEKTKYNRQLDYDLEITNASTNEVYKNDTDLIEKNSRVHIKRVIKNPSGPLRSQPPKNSSQPSKPFKVSSALITPSPSPIQQLPTQPTPLEQPKPQVLTQPLVDVPLKTFAQPNNKNVDKSFESLMPLNVPIATPLIVQQVDPSSKTEESIAEAKKEEKSKLESLFASNQQQLQQYDQKRYQNRWSKTNLLQRQANYICSLCKKTGHPRHQCPEIQSGNISREELFRPKYPHGIPRGSMIKVDQHVPGAMLGPEGYVMPLIDLEASKSKPTQKIFLTEEEEKEQERKKQLDDLKNESQAYPKELTCPFSSDSHGKHLIKDAVLLPCCGHFVCCDECIREKIANNESVECTNKECGVEIDSIESVTPYHPVRKLIQDYINEQKASKLVNLTKKDDEKKTEDPLVDSLLNDVINNETKPILLNEIKIELPKVPSSEISNDCQSESLPPKSPLQDSKISSSITNGHSQMTSAPSLTNVAPNDIVKQESDDKTKVFPSILISSNEQRIPRLPTIATTSIVPPVSIPNASIHYTRPSVIHQPLAYRPMQRPLISYPPMSQSQMLIDPQYMPIASTSTSMHTNVLPQTVMHPYHHQQHHHHNPYLMRPSMPVQQQLLPSTNSGGFMSEAEFYRFKEKLREKEKYETNVNEFIKGSSDKRRSRSRSRSSYRRHGRSRSRSRSHYRHAKRRSRSTTRRRSRSRSRSSSHRNSRRRRSRSYERKRSHEKSTAKYKKRSRSRTRRSRTRSRNRNNSRDSTRRSKRRTRSRSSKRASKDKSNINVIVQDTKNDDKHESKEKLNDKHLDEKNTSTAITSNGSNNNNNHKSDVDEPLKKHKKSVSNEKQQDREIDTENDDKKSTKHKKSKKKHKHKHSRSKSRH